MTAIVQIDDEVIDIGEFVRLLKLTGQFDGLIEQLVRDKLTVRAAKKHGVVVTDEEIQARADQFRRIRGLHRAADMNNYLDALDVEPRRVRGVHHGHAVPGKDAGSRSAATMRSRSTSS